MGILNIKKENNVNYVNKKARYGTSEEPPWNEEIMS